MFKIKTRIRFTVELIGNSIVLMDSTTKLKHGVALSSDISKQLLQEIIIACQSEFSKYYTAMEIKQDILPIIVSAYAASCYIHETECYRLCSDGSILYNETYLSIENRFILALDGCHIAGVLPENGPEYIKQELDRLNNCGVELGEAESKYCYSKSVEALHSIESKRIADARKAMLEYISIIQCKNKYQEIKTDPWFEMNSLATSTKEKNEEETVAKLNTF